MSVDSSVSVVSSANSTTAATKSSVANKSSSDASFKDEMNKVNKSVETKDNKEVKEPKSETDKSENKEVKTDDSKQLISVNDNKLKDENSNLDNLLIDGKITFSNSYTSLSDANNLLTNDIQQMIDNTFTINSLNQKSWVIGLGNESKSNITVSESDAEFFLNLTQNNDISMSGIVNQAQNMLNNSASVTDVRQNVQVSHALLNALNEARQNNQPLRIDFDQNIAVILRIGKDGSLSANFIPGDKAVEQYLKSNIESLRNTFEEKDLPYSELSYSNSSKRENERRRNKQQQGE